MDRGTNPFLRIWAITSALSFFPVKLPISLLAAFAFFALSFSSCKKAEEKTVAKVYFTYEIGYYEKVEGTAGNPSFSRCTTGDGACSMDVKKPGWRPEGKLPEGYGFGAFRLNAAGQLQMIIYMPNITDGTYRDHYEDGLMHLPGPWKLALEVTSQLGLTDGYSVKMGDYTIRLGKDDGYDVLIVTFSV